MTHSSLCDCIIHVFAGRSDEQVFDVAASTIITLVTNDLFPRNGSVGQFPDNAMRHADFASHFNNAIPLALKGASPHDAPVRRRLRVVRYLTASRAVALQPLFDL